MVNVTKDEFAGHLESGDGLCLKCGKWSKGGVEPDAKGYECESCGAEAVSGCMRVLILNRIKFVEEV